MSIEKYSFEGDARSARVDSEGDILVEVYENMDFVYFTKKDVIKMAESVGVKPEDIK